MKRTLLKSFSIFLAMVMLVTQTQTLAARNLGFSLPSIDESMLVLDEVALESAMAELNELESFLSTNEGVTYDDLLTSGSDLILNVDDASAPLGLDQDEEPPLGIPSFLWGCVFGLVGILIVYIVTDGDKDETKKALWGMLVWVGVFVIFYVAFWGTFWSWY
ncbi:MAG: hypothetical protein EHM46_02425 [Bacteroidetes bacterium]|nr:MAG: hypothetical protein EHM46_02425 [Bacteroidota bacterium]